MNATSMVLGLLLFELVGTVQGKVNCSCHDGHEFSILSHFADHRPDEVQAHIDERIASIDDLDLREDLARAYQGIICKSEHLRPALLELAGDADPIIRVETIRVLGATMFMRTEVMDVVRGALGDEVTAVRLQALGSISDACDLRSIETVEQLLVEEWDQTVIQRAQTVLAHLKRPCVPIPTKRDN